MLLYQIKIACLPQGRGLFLLHLLAFHRLSAPITTSATNNKQERNAMSEALSTH